jgi:signal transduction histidine kinase
VATNIVVRSDALSHFADFLRSRQAVLVADWRQAERLGPRAGLPLDSSLEHLAAQWIEDIAALADRRSAGGQVPSRGAAPDPSIPLATALSELVILYRVIAGRAHVEQGGLAAPEAELLWNALQSGVEKLTTHHAAMRPDARGTATQREQFLGEASRTLAESLDYEATLKTVARLAVAAIADWCNVDLLNDQGALVRVATEFRAEHFERWAAALHRHPPKPDALSGAPSVVRSGRTEYVPVISEALLRRREDDQERLSILRQLGLHSTICTPLIARDHVLGAITLSTGIGRTLTLEDVRMAEDLAGRAALAIDNARLYQEAQRAIHAREEILAIVTHDLRTPLSAVAAGASLLTSFDSAEPDGARIRRRGEAIGRAARHMSRLVKDLTDLAQMDAGRLTVDRTLDDPLDVLREVIDALEPVVTRRGGTLHVRTPATLPQLLLDRDRVRQVLANLVGNASNAGASHITIAVDIRGDDVVFSVADDGPGVPASDAARMFDRYWRGRGARYEGSGLGLPIANGIVKAHGGRMWLESTAGQGSTFFFSLPRPASGR